jgi:Flp pilus assembly protein TadD
MSDPAEPRKAGTPIAAPASAAQVEALVDAGRKAHFAGRLDQAMAHYQEALTRDPYHVGALNNMGVALKVLNRFAPACAYYRRALALKPDDAGMLSNFGNALRGLGAFEEAESVLKRSLALRPNSFDAVHNLALVYKASRRWAEATAGLIEALRLKPDHAEAHFDLAVVYLQTGDLVRGFAEYEWRWQMKESPPRQFEAPKWTGALLEGRTILLYAEQGFGDTIQFVRYVPEVTKSGGRVVLECQPELVQLLQSVEGAAAVVPRGVALPPHDVQAPLLSLPRILGTTLTTIPSPGRYLAPPPALAAKFRARIGQVGNALNIGLVWAGKPSHKNDYNRSAGLAPFIDLLGLPGTRWFSLQVGPRAGDIKAHACAGLIDDLAPELNDFTDTAAAIDALDLVITVDTSVVHLAGALDRPVWLAQAFGGEWRYLDGRTDSPWYPSLRIFQQVRQGDWPSVFERINVALQAREGLTSIGRAAL